MTEALHVKQKAVVPIRKMAGAESEVSQIAYMRRASPEFAHEVGGPLVQKFLDIAKDAGYVSANSLVRTQPTPFQRGAYPTPPHWHFDFIPGIALPRYRNLENAITSNTGLIACLFDREQHPDDKGTLFLEGDDIVLDLKKRDPHEEYIPGKNFAPDSDTGDLYWWDEPVRSQVATNDQLRVKALEPNVVYAYGSDNIHCVPIMRSNNGVRVNIRINTPSDPNMQPPVENKLMQPGDPDFPHYVFYQNSPTEWRRQTVRMG